MNTQEIDLLIEQIQSIQINLINTRDQLNLIRDRVVQVKDNVPNPPDPEEGTDRPLNIGDNVEILNPVRLRGSIRSSRNVRGTVHRFTQGDYVIVRVVLRSRNNVETYQDIRRARHNVGHIIEVSNSE